MLDELRRLVAFTTSVHRYLRTDFSVGAVDARLTDTLRTRPDRLLALIEHGILRRPTSPYRALLEHAGIDLADVRGLVSDHGVEGALELLRDEGVHVTVDELKGRTEIVRGSLRLRVEPEHFDNPLRSGGELVARSGGTSGMPVRVGLGVDDLVEDIGYVRLWIEAAGLRGRPLVVWRSVPPARSGLRNGMRALRSGLEHEQWWSPTPFGLRIDVRDAVALRVALGVVRAHRERIPSPRHAPLAHPEPVVEAIAALVRSGRPPVLAATAGAAVRASLAATRLGLPLTGTVVLAGGEPLTASKTEAIRAAGAEPCCHYQAHEIGRIGFACAEPVAPDDAHIASGRVAVIPGAADGSARRLLLTCLSPTSQRIMLNADIGDTGVLERRACSCRAHAIGLDLHVHTIRAVAKLTTDGTNILHSELLDLVERRLPGRFGGGPTDYQLVEGEVGGVPQLRVVVTPSVGRVDDAAVIDVVLAAVAEGPAWRGMTARLWRDGGTVTVERREPFATHVGKVHAFHVERDA